MKILQWLKRLRQPKRVASEPSEAPVRSSDGLCGCLQCLRDRNETMHGLPIEMCRMIVCETCGNKRCPHATNHRHACTGSNEPGQKGSRWENVKPHNEKLSDSRE